MGGPPEGGAASLAALLATKLHVPRARHGLVSRPRLVDLLTEAVAGELTMVCAPAGFGKTALLADWAQRSGRLVAWLSLDAGDNDPVRFWRHVAAALEGVRDGVGQRLAPLLGPPSPRSFEAVVTMLVNELAAGTDELVLVLDDYHLIESQAVHRSLTFLLEHLPASLRLALACRADPPLPLARLRASGELAELRTGELRFTLQETAALLHQAVGPGLTADAIAVLEARSEGWVTRLQLAALSLRGRAGCNAPGDAWGRPWIPIGARWPSAPRRQVPRCQSWGSPSWAWRQYIASGTTSLPPWRSRPRG